MPHLRRNPSTLAYCGMNTKPVLSVFSLVGGIIYPPEKSSLTIEADPSAVMAHISEHALTK